VDTKGEDQGGPPSMVQFDWATLWPNNKSQQHFEAPVVDNIELLNILDKIRQNKH